MERGYQYYIKWKGYPESEGTWEPSKNLLPQAAVILAEYIVEKDLPSPKSIPIYEKDAWLNQYAKQFVPKEESKEYPE